MIEIKGGDVLDVLRLEPSDSFDGCLTDPPYGLGFMGKAWDAGVPSAEVWREVLRVLNPGAPILAFGGSRTYHRLAVAIEDAGFELRDCLMWIYGSGFPKSHDISKGIDKSAGAEREVVGFRSAESSVCSGPGDSTGSHKWTGILRSNDPATPDAQRFAGYGTALKPAYEPILLGMKPTRGTFAQNAIEFGVAGLNIDGSRIGATGGTHKHDAPKHDSKSAYGNGLNGGGGKGREINAGRWPANVLLDEDAAQGKEWARFFYVAKASRRERGEGNIHPTVKPIALAEYLAKLILPPAGRERRLLVPFSGSGSEMIGARNAGWDSITGIEISEEYCSIAEKRIA